MSHKAGFVNIIGLPNVGKSTLMNALVGERMAIISPKAQTTRHRLLGFLNHENFQIVFSDTPGFINQPAYKLHENMNAFVHQALEDADVLLFVTDRFQKNDEQNHLVEIAAKAEKKCIVILNKVDACKSEDVAAAENKWRKLLPEAAFLPIAAQHRLGIEKLIEMIVEQLPESPPYYDKDDLTNRPLRFFISEIVREKIFFNYEKEIPYSCEVVVEEYEEGKTMDKIRCAIYVDRDSQKPILIGRNGDKITKTGKEAREQIEAFIGKKVFLELRVKVRKGWREDENTLKQLGY